MARLALMTAAILTKEWGDPAIKEFEDRIDATVRTLEHSEGFIASDFDDAAVWGEMTVPKLLDRPEFAGRYAYTLSLWEDLESVFAYAYNATHGNALRHRSEWFVKGEWPVAVAWWVADDHVPTHAEGAARYQQFYEQGPTAAAFDFKHPFDAQGNAAKLDRQQAREKAAKIPFLDWREDGGHTQAA